LNEIQWHGQYGANEATAPPGLPKATSVIRADSEICRVFSAGVDVLGWTDMGDVKTGLQTPKQHQKGLL
jgi:hypothetical protein